ncbi:MAG: glucosamine-6-phosphate deaminase [Cyclobacteriaceae bacterium]|nr:glucosamine-6-phosphate deaminase [Cyclobacteriaceae bacterium]
MQVDNLKINIHTNEQEAGEAAALFVESQIKEAIESKGFANVILATGTSQFAFIEALKKKSIAWDKIRVFHLDEYKNLSDEHPASFRKYLKERILNIVKPAHVHLIDGDAEDLEVMIRSYEDLLKKHPVDIACIGIGENGHIAFNDPPVADFNDPKLVKVVELDDACRKQQFGEGWFPTLDDVPKYAVTLTIPAILQCKAISCMVPGKRKAQAVSDAIHGPINTSCPASILRQHPQTQLFLDEESSSLINA